MGRLRVERENDDETIEPCPHCEVGGALLTVCGTGNLALPYTEYSFVSCDNCHAQGRRFYGANRVRAAIKNWNRVALAAIACQKEVND